MLTLYSLVLVHLVSHVLAFPEFRASSYQRSLEDPSLLAGKVVINNERSRDARQSSGFPTYHSASSTDAEVQNVVFRKMSKAKASPLTVEQKCDLLVQAFVNLVNVLDANLDEQGRDSIRNDMLQTTGVDISDMDHIRQEACNMARISSLSEFAQRLRIPLDVMRQYYPVFVESINEIRSQLRKYLSNPYVTFQTKIVYRAILYFYECLDTIGLLTLS